MIAIQNPHIEYVKEGKTRLLSRISDTVKGIDEEIWYEVDEKYGQYFCNEVSDAFLVAVLLNAVKYNEDITIDGCVSQHLLYHVENYVLPLLQYYVDNKRAYHHNVRIFANTFVTDYQPMAVGTGCSLGVDSFSVILPHISEQCLSNYRLTHLTLFNTGSYGKYFTEKTESSFMQDVSRVRSFSEKIGLPLVTVNTNLHVLYYDFCFDQTHSLLNMSVVLSLQKLFRVYYYASAHPVNEFAFDVAAIAKIDAVLLPNLSTEHTDLQSADFFRRCDKVEHIADDRMVQQELFVCLKEQISNRIHPNPILENLKKQGLKKNCSHCKKCLRTLVILDILGKLDSFSGIFDVEYYKRIRVPYLAKLWSLRNKDLFAQETFVFMKEKNVDLPFQVKVLSLIFVMANHSVRLNNRINRKLEFVE